MTNSISISPSLEDYLEAILILKEKNKIVRIKDIAKFLKIKAASVNETIKKLKLKKLVTHEHYGYVDLTKQGIIIAKEIYHRHKTIKKFLINILNIEEKIAEKDACKIEHYLSKTTLNQLVKFIDFTENCPNGFPEWLTNFYYFSDKNQRPEICKKEIKKTMDKTNKTYMSLDKVPINTKVRIVKIVNDIILKNRLQNIGFIKGEIIEIKKIAPLGSPIDILIKGSHISLRKDDTSKIIVEVINDTTITDR